MIKIKINPCRFNS